MLVYITKELSWEIAPKFDQITPIHALIKECFINKDYGSDLTTLYIGIICESAQFAD